MYQQVNPTSYTFNIKNNIVLYFIKSKKQVTKKIQNKNFMLLKINVKSVNYVINNLITKNSYYK